MEEEAQNGHRMAGCTAARVSRKAGREFRNISKIFSEDDMRALVVFLFVLGAVAFMASCGSEVTEVAWKNVSATNLKVHEILWTQDNISWVDKTNGYAANTGVPTESKEVTSLSSNVECLVWDSVNEKFEAVSQVEVSGGKYSMGNSASLNEGESQVLNVNPQ